MSSSCLPTQQLTAGKASFANVIITTGSLGDRREAEDLLM